MAGVKTGLFDGRLMKHLSLLLIVAAGTIYQICSKNVPEGANLFSSLIVTYLVALTVSLILFFLTKKDTTLFQQIRSLNFWQIILGIVLVAYDFGYQLAYRNGWGVGKLQPIVGAALLILLCIVSVLVYHETVSAKYLAGLVMIGCGILLTIQ